MTNGLRHHPGRKRLRSWAEEKKWQRRHRIFWRVWYAVAGLFFLITVFTAIYR